METIALTPCVLIIWPHSSLLGFKMIYTCKDKLKETMQKQIIFQINISAKIK